MANQVLNAGAKETYKVRVEFKKDRVSITIPEGKTKDTLERN